MIFNKKNSIWSLLKVPFLYAPLLSVITMVQKLAEALLPAVSVLAVSGFINTAVDIFSGKLPQHFIYRPLLYIVLVMGFQLLFGTVTGYAVRKMRIRLENRISLECIDRQASTAFEYIDHSESFMLMKKVFGEVASQIHTIYNDALGAVGLSVRYASIMLIFVSNGLWWIGVLILLASVPMIYVTYKNGTKIYRFYKENFPGQMEMYHSTYILKDRSLTDERTLYGFSDAVNSKWKKMQMDLYAQKKQVNVKILFHRYLSRFLNLGCAMAVIIIMTFSVIRGSLDVGLYIALVTNIIVLIDQVISSVMLLANNLAQEKEFLKDLDTVCNYKYDPDDLCAADGTPFSVESIEFIHVSFTYPGTKRRVLDNVSFRLDEGMHYAFVGRNGAGKSTIIKLLTGLYHDYEGTILINQKDLKEYSCAERKGMFGIIYQDYAKYELTLKESVKIGDIHSVSQNDDTYMQKLSDVNLLGLLQTLPKGGDTFLGKTEEGGQDISGGEWQRVAIARLLMKKGNFMILDEPTAALDPVAESALYQQFLAISRKKTTLLISHRLGSVKTADCIFVIDGGKIAESGSHRELIEKSGIYEKMYSEQKEWYQ